MAYFGCGSDGRDKIADYMQRNCGEKNHKNLGEWLALKTRHWQIISSFTEEET
jgi:hypothetical protein